MKKRFDVVFKNLIDDKGFGIHLLPVLYVAHEKWLVETVSIIYLSWLVWEINIEFKWK